MTEYLPETTDYLIRFFSSKYDQYFENMKELRPEKGYGFYYRSPEVTQSIRNIVHNISGTFVDMRIPESFPSPKNLIETLINFKKMLERQNDIYADVFKHYEGKHEPPIPVYEIHRINNEVLEAISHVLAFGEVQQYLLPNQDVDHISHMAKLHKILSRFHLVATQLTKRRSDKGTPRSTLAVIDEYDVQDLLFSLLRLEFDDIRAEVWTPDYAGGASRMDFLLREEKIIIEVKKTRDSLKDKALGEQLIVDKEKYKHYPGIQFLVCFIYDPDGYVENPKGLIHDLNSMSDDTIKVSTVINPLS